MEYKTLEVVVSNNDEFIYPDHLFCPQDHELNTRVIITGLEFVKSPEYQKLQFLQKKVNDLEFQRTKDAELLKQQKNDYFTQLQELKDNEHSLMEAKERENSLLVIKMKEMSEAHFAQLNDLENRYRETELRAVEATKRELEHVLELTRSQLNCYKEQKAQEMESLMNQLNESKAQQQEQYDNGLAMGKQSSLAELRALQTQTDNLHTQLEEAKVNLQYETDKTRIEVKRAFEEGMTKAQNESATELTQSRLHLAQYASQVLDLQQRLASAAIEIGQKYQQGLLDAQKLNLDAGKQGESYFTDLYDQITDIPNSKLIDVSHIPNHGDRHLIIGNVRILIEIKNRKEYDKREVTKFYRDLEVCG